MSHVQFGPSSSRKIWGLKVEQPEQKYHLSTMMGFFQKHETQIVFGCGDIAEFSLEGLLEISRMQVCEHDLTAAGVEFPSLQQIRCPPAVTPRFSIKYHF